MAHDLIRAVTDGPEGCSVAALPLARQEALALKSQFGNAFWCTEQAGGCGSRVFLVAGPLVRPYFRHEQRAKCRYLDDPAAAIRGYEHLEYQIALEAWVSKQGFTCVLERRLGVDGRTDLHVAVAEVNHSIEVQLSPISVAEWADREQRYRRHVTEVTWLYGPNSERAASTEVARRGVALMLQPGPRLGVLDVDEELSWADLDACRLTAQGLVVPGQDRARALATARAKERAEAEARELALEAARADRKRLDAEKHARRRASADVGAVWRHGQSRGAAQGDPLAEFSALNPDAASWDPPGGWGWLSALPVDDHQLGRAFAYTTQRLLLSAPTGSLLREVVDGTQRSRILMALASAGWIELEGNYFRRRDPLQR